MVLPCRLVTCNYFIDSIPTDKMNGNKSNWVRLFFYLELESLFNQSEIFSLSNVTWLPWAWTDRNGGMTQIGFDRSYLLLGFDSNPELKQ